MPSQALYLSSNKPWKATFSTEDGLVLFKCESHSHLTKISRAISSDPSTLETAFAHLAEVEYHTFRSSRIRYGGEEKTVDEIFKRKGWGVFGRDRIFSGPDGKDYAWKLTSDACKLVVNDSSKNVVACFHRKKGGLFGQARPAYLEVFEGGQHMLDLIVITFVYTEKLQREREDATLANSG